jgi:hypothetical protein
MKKCYFIILLTFLFAQNIFAINFTDPAKKDTTKTDRMTFSVGGGYIYTSLNFFKNYQEETYYGGNGFRVLARFSDRFRLCASRDQVQSINIEPSWLNVKNVYYDLDMHFISHFQHTKNIAYFILGASAQYWNGFYTGIHDLNAWRVKIPINTYYHTLYFGVTAGAGVEIKLYGPISLYGELRWRASKTDLGTGLSDVLYGAGLKLDIPSPKPKKNGHHHSILKFRDKYHWF